MNGEMNKMNNEKNSGSGKLFKFHERVECIFRHISYDNQIT